MRKVYATIVTIIAVVSLLSNFLLYERYSSQRPLITVNGQVIHRKDLDDRLDYLYSNNILRLMINTDLVMQEAQRKHVVPSDADVQREFDQINRARPGVIVQQQKLDPQLILFKQGLKTDMALTNLRTQGIRVSDQEVQAFYDAHRPQFALPQQASEILVVATDPLDAQTAQRLLANNVKPAVIAETKGLRVVGINAQPSGMLPANLTQPLMTGKPGDIRTVRLGNQYLIAKMQKVSAQQIPSLDDVRPLATRAAMLAKAPTEQKIMNDLIERAHIVVNTDKYKGAVPTVSGEQVASAKQ